VPDYAHHHAMASANNGVVRGCMINHQPMTTDCQKSPHQKVHAIARFNQATVQ